MRIGTVGLGDAVPSPAVATAPSARVRTRRSNTFSDRASAALRERYGGHTTAPARCSDPMEE